MYKDFLRQVFNLLILFLNWHIIVLSGQRPYYIEDKEFNKHFSLSFLHLIFAIIFYLQWISTELHRLQITINMPYAELCC